MKKQIIKLTINNVLSNIFLNNPRKVQIKNRLFNSLVENDSLENMKLISWELLEYYAFNQINICDEYIENLKWIVKNI